MLISIVMPTLNEAANLPVRAREIAEQTGPYEWIVSDGGSRDATIAFARASGASVVRGVAGRGSQLDAGAAHALGDVVLFLHADTSLPVGALDAIRSALREPAYVGGNFTLRFDDRGPIGTALAGAYALQQRLLGLYFGDSAIFVRRSIFERTRGYGPLPIMEDYEFTRALGRLGRVVRLRAVVTTSARRYRKRPLRTIFVWLTIFVLYRCGVPARHLLALYRPGAAQQHAPPV